MCVYVCMSVCVIKRYARELEARVVRQTGGRVKGNLVQMRPISAGRSHLYDRPISTSRSDVSCLAGIPPYFPNHEWVMPDALAYLGTHRLT